MRARLRGLTGLVVAVGLGIGLSGCNGGDEPIEGKGARFGDGDLYVALGDSYTAAPGTGRVDGTDGCFRSMKDYPHLLAEATGMTLRDVSCGGATTKSLTGEQRTFYTTVPAQLDEVVKGTDLVTLRIGGNDDGMWPQLIGGCSGRSPEDDGAKCEKVMTKGRGLTTEGDDLEAAVTAIIRQVQGKAPDALVLVVGYPEIFPDGTKGCAALPIQGDSIRTARRYNLMLNTALEGAAEATGARYVDAFASSEGHNVCSKDPWIAGATTKGKPKGAAAMHPYVDEAENVTRLLLAEIS